MRGLQGGWWDRDRTGPQGRRVLRSALFGDEAQTIARSFGTLKTSQLRKFFDELKGLDERVRSAVGEEDRAAAFWEVLPLVKKVKAMAAYAATKSTTKIPFEFRRFLEVGVDQVNDSHEELHAFVLLFETVAGYAHTSQ